MLKLAAFADEISPVLSEQIRVCREVGVTHVELRSVQGTNVLDFDTATRHEIRDRLRDAGMGVACIGSPIGKVRIDEPWEKHLDRFKIAVELAIFFEAPLVRIFSYYPPDGGEILSHRQEVLRRMRAGVELVSQLPVTLVHENESRIYGQHCAQCVDLMTAIDSSKLRTAFDFANFILCGEMPRDNWGPLKQFTTHIHVKDAISATGQIVPAGQGDGDIAMILSDAVAGGYSGFVSLEPHLSSAGQFSGYSGPDLFRAAAMALRELCRRHSIPLEGNR